MQHGIGGAPWTLADPATGRTIENGRITSSVDEDQHLLAFIQPGFYCLEQMRGKALFQTQTPGVDKPDLGQRHIAGTTRERYMGVAALLYVIPRLERRSCRTQHDRNTQIVSTPNCQITRRITEPILLLVAGVMLFVYDDQAQARHGLRDRHACAEQDLGVAAERA